MSRLLRAHDRQNGLGHGHVAEKVGFQLVAELVEGHVFGKSSHAETGVVHQHVNPAVIADDGVHRARQRIEFGDVEPPQVEAIAHPGLMRCLLKTTSGFEVAHGRHHAIAVERQLDGG